MYLQAAKGESSTGKRKKTETSGEAEKTEKTGS